MTEELEEYDASAGDFETLLTEDHELLEELVDDCSLLAIAEAVKQSEETEQETLEIAYLNVIDKLAQLMGVGSVERAAAIPLMLAGNALKLTGKIARTPIHLVSGIFNKCCKWAGSETR